MNTHLHEPKGAQVNAIWIAIIPHGISAHSW